MKLYKLQKFIIFCILLLNVLFLISRSKADTEVGAYIVFTGPNVYSPTLLFDQQDVVYKMWYGGYQQDGQSEDNIYYRTSNDGMNWSSYVTVITPEEIETQYEYNTGNSVSIDNTNDPSVTKFFNYASNEYQYTMFFSVCYSPCSAGNNAIWSMVSTDGVNWLSPMPLQITLPDGVGGPANPSAVFDQSGPYPTIWHIYFSAFTGDTHDIFMAYVGGDRSQSIGEASIVLYNEPSYYAANPSVIQVGNLWYLFYNVSNQYGGYDIAYATSTDNTAFPNPSYLLTNNNQPYCATVTPGAIAIDSTHYNTYFSLIPSGTTPGENCDFYQNQQMGLWQWSTQ